MDPQKIVDWRERRDDAQAQMKECLFEAAWIIAHLRDEISSLEVKLEVAEHALAEAERLGIASGE